MNKREREKCMRVAQDVIDHLRLLDVRSGVYCDGELPSTCEDASGDDSARKHIDGISKECRVCAVGAMFLSYVRVYNKTELSEFMGHSYGLSAGDDFEVDLDVIQDKLHTVFMPPQLELIECAFEQGPVNQKTLGIAGDEYCSDEDWAQHDPNSECTGAEMRAAEDFGDKYNTPMKRLRAIMQNIVKNEGLFIPDKKLHKQIAENVKQAKRTPVEIV